MAYDAEPSYPLSTGEVEHGSTPLVADVARRAARVIAIEGRPPPSGRRSSSRSPPLSAPRPLTCGATTCHGRRFAIERVTASFRETPSSPAFAPGHSPISSTRFHRFPKRAWCSSMGRAARSSPMTCSGTPTSRSASASTRCSAAQPETSASRRARPARSNACSSSTGRSSSDTSRVGADHRSLHRGQRSRAAPIALRRRASLDVARSRRTTLPHAAHVPSWSVGWSMAPSTPRHRNGRPQPRLVVRADHAGERDPPRRRPPLEVGFDLLMALEGPRILEPRSRSASAFRSRCASTTSTRWKEGTCRSSAIRPSRMRARPSGSSTRRTRRTT